MKDLINLNTSDSTDAQIDPDQDDLTNLEEYFNHTDPTNPDTDGDGFKDGLEIDKDTDPLDDGDYPRDDNKESDSDYFAGFRYILFLIIIILILVIIISKLKGKKEKD